MPILCFFKKVLQDYYNRFTCIQSKKKQKNKQKKTLSFSHNIHCTSPLFSQCLKQFDKGFSLSKPLLSKAQSVVIGQMAQSVMIGQMAQSVVICQTAESVVIG